MTELEYYKENKAKDIDKRINIYLLRKYNLKSIKDIEYFDKNVQRDIKELEEMIELLKYYRLELYERSQELLQANYKLKLSFIRDKSYTTKLITYTLKIEKIFNVERMDNEKIYFQQFNGKERKQATIKYNELLKQYPNIETEIDLEKKYWEK